MQCYSKGYEKLSLQAVINKLLKYSSEIARKNNTAIINSVQQGIYLKQENHKVIPVITELIETVVSNARNSEICITAERFRDLVILQVQDTNNFNGYALGFSLQSMENEALGAGAVIQFKNQQQRVATVSLSFSN